MSYNLLLIGGTRDGDIMKMDSLERFYVIVEKLEPEPVSPRHPNYNRPIKKVLVETWHLSYYVLTIGDAVWEYAFLMEADYAKQRKPDFIYDYDLSQTYLRRLYAFDYTWNHWPCTRNSQTVLAK
jgi:hypothetical protein